MFMYMGIKMTNNQSRNQLNIESSSDPIPVNKDLLFSNAFQT